VIRSAITSASYHPRIFGLSRERGISAAKTTQYEMLKLDRLRSQKRGLMQKLLAGDWQLGESFK